MKTLENALEEKFDAFYASVASKVAFDKCELGYIVDSEGPQEAVVFENGVDYGERKEEL